MTGIDTFLELRSIANIERLLAALASRRMTARELADHLCMCKSNVIRYLKHLQSEPRKVRIFSYRYSSGRYAPVYGCGHAPDALAPTKAPPKLKYARARAAITADPEKFDLFLAKRRACERADRAAKIPNTWLNILGGGA